MVKDHQHIFFSPLSSSFRTSRLPSPTNNNKIVSPHHTHDRPPNYLLHHYSRKRANSTLPPLGPGSPRSRKGRVTRTVPSSRAGSSKLSRLEVEGAGGMIGKRSRSASEEAYNHLSSKIIQPTSNSILQHSTNSNQLRSVSNPLISSTTTTQSPTSPIHHNRPRRLTKVETVRVLRARSALLLPLNAPTLNPHHPLQSPQHLPLQQLLVSSEERKKKRR